MPKLSHRLACAALALTLAAPRAADAGPAEARVHIDRATAAHRAGDLDQALVELRAAYAQDPQPQLLYAQGQVYTKLGRCSDAKDAYLRFLASGTDARTAQLVRQALDACEPRPAEPASAPPPEPPPPAPPPRVAERTAPPAPEPPAPAPRGPEGAPWYRDVVGGALVGGGAIALALGGLAYRAARADLDTAESVSSHDRYTELVDGARTKRVYAAVLAGGGAALVTAGVLRFVLRDRAPEARRVSVVPASGGGLVSWTRSF